MWQRGLAALVVVIWAAYASPSQSASNTAEQFAKQLIDQGFAILRDESLEKQVRRDKFHTFILRHVDARRTALFTLGVYRRSASPEVLERFVSAFAEYSTAIYESRLEQYKSATMTVVSSLENKPGDITVMTSAQDATLREPLMVGFRLAAGSGTYKIIDVQAAGIWLSVEQREQFGSLLSRNNGDVAALTDEIARRTGDIRAARH
jgi:phospholipid transport system substrate-binding protein